MSDARPTRLARALPWALTVSEYRTLDRAAPLAAALPLALVALTVAVLHAARGMPPDATPIDLGRRVFQVYFGLTHLATLLLAPVASAWLAAPARGPARRDLLSLAGVSAGTLVRARLAAAVGGLGSVLVASAPMAVVPFFFDGVSGRAVGMGFLSLALSLVAASLAGQFVGASAPSPGSALARASLASAAFTLMAWHFVGRGLGRALTASLRLGYHGASWWPELVTNPSLDAGLRHTLLAAPIVLSVCATWLLFSLAARATANLPAFHTLHVRLAMVATSFVGADLAARVTLHTRHTRLALSTGAATGITALAAFSLVMVFVILGEPADAPARKASPRLAALERWLGRTQLPGLLVLLAVSAVEIGGLTRRVVRVIKTVSEGPMMAGYEPILVALQAVALLTFAAGLGALLKALLPEGGARRWLAASLAALWLLPRPLRFVMGGAESPWRLARRVLAFSPSRTQELIAHYTHLRLNALQFRMLHLSNTPEVVAAAAATAAQFAVGCVALAAAAVVLHRRARRSRG